MQKDLLKPALAVRARAFRVLRALAAKSGHDPGKIVLLAAIVSYIGKHRGDAKYDDTFVKRELADLMALGHVVQNGEGYSLAMNSDALALVVFVKRSTVSELARHRSWIDPEKRSLRPARIEEDAEPLAA